MHKNLLYAVLPALALAAPGIVPAAAQAPESGAKAGTSRARQAI